MANNQDIFIDWSKKSPNGIKRLVQIYEFCSDVQEIICLIILSFKYLSLVETMTLIFFFLKLGQFDTSFLAISFTKNVDMHLTSVLLTHF